MNYYQNLLRLEFHFLSVIIGVSNVVMPTSYNSPTNFCD